MQKFKTWISALRFRTLCLAIACTILGSGVAYASGTFDIPVFILTILTATFLQLLSNLANDLGDYRQGTDITGERVGPERAVQSGIISAGEMKIGIIIAMLISCICGGYLILHASTYLSAKQIILFFVLGIASIIAAVKYTAGKNPYGYMGLGDFFSFLFFGPIAVIGTYFLHTHTFDFRPILPALSMGFLTASVLNVNNMRDIENDKKSGKITIPVRIGLKNAKKYHAVLIIGAFLCAFGYGILYVHGHLYQLSYLAIFILFFIILKNIFKTSENKLLDPYLKQTSISTLIFSIIFSICINL